MPDEVQQVFGFALYHAQIGLLHPSAKPLKGFGSAGVVEIVEDCFEKKSKRGIETPKREMDLIRERLKQAQAQALEVEE